MYQAHHVMIVTVIIIIIIIIIIFIIIITIITSLSLLLLFCTVLVTSCREMGGAVTSSRNVQCWDEALGLARKHHDIMLEAMTTKCMGGGG